MKLRSDSKAYLVSFCETAERLGTGNRPVHALTASLEWRDLIEPVTRLKATLDRVLNELAWHQNEVTEADLKRCQELGFPYSDQPSGQGLCPNKFVKWILGPFSSQEDTSPIELARVPSWSTVGWHRKRYQARNACEAQKKRKAIDAKTIDGSDGTARWRSPVPLVTCGEGKNRAELHAKFFTDQLTNLGIDALPPIETLRLKRVVGTDKLVALQCWTPSAGWTTALLPFPELSLPIFEAIGVRRARSHLFGWWLVTPWCNQLKEIVGATDHPAAKRVGLALRPARMRAAMLANKSATR